MSPRELKPPLFFDPYAIPPAIRWRIQTDVPSLGVEEFCRGIRSSVQAANGTSYYYPIGTKTRCRHEWHHSHDGDRFALRLGVQFEVSPGRSIRRVNAYCALAAAYETSTVGRPGLDAASLRRAKRRLQRIVETATTWNEQAQRRCHYSFLLSLPHGFGLADRFITRDQGTTAFKTRIWRHDRMTALVIHLDAVSRQDGRSEALALFERWRCCATLLVGQHVAEYNRPIPHSCRGVTMVRDLAAILRAEARIYPRTSILAPVAECNTLLPAAMPQVWMDMHQLNPQEADRYWRALFAFDAAMAVDATSPTLASVAYIAALGALSGANREKCKGDLSCSSCGALSFRHDLIGDQKATLAMCMRELHLSSRSAKAKTIATVLRRVYSTQRSSYVHDAVLRHSEHLSKYRVPQCMPTTGGRRRAEYESAADLARVRDIVRSVMLSWLEKRSTVRYFRSQSERLPPLRHRVTYQSEGSARGDRLSQMKPETTEEIDERMSRAYGPRWLRSS